MIVGIVFAAMIICVAARVWLFVLLHRQVTSLERAATHE